MLKRKVPFYTVLIAFLLSIVLTSFTVYWIKSKSDESNMEASESPGASCNYNVERLTGYQFIRPLLFAEPACESATLLNTKTEIESLIDSYKAAGTITSASVYLREFHQGEWISINDQEKYSPGSLLKVPELITFIKMNETQPGLLDKKILFDKSIASDKTATYLSKSIKLGETYTIRQLLDYMITYSDNNATLILNKIIDVNIFKKVFTDIGLTAPDFNAKEYPITARDYSYFMKGLYNASYLTIPESEYCAEMLSNCDFKDGIVAGLPTGCKVIHKFGEGGYDNSPQFSESAIIYCNHGAYLLTIMTKGSDMKKMPQVLSAISKKVYETLNTIL